MTLRRMCSSTNHAARFAASLIVWLVATSGTSGSYKEPTRLSALSAPVLHTVSVGRDPVALTVDEHVGRVFVLGSAGSVTTLNATTGVVIRTVAVGGDAQAVAVDEATGRAFVTDQGRVFTLNAQTGAIVRAIPVVGGPARGLAVDTRRGEVFVAARGVNHGPAGSGPGSIVVLDATTGLPRRTGSVKSRS